MEGGGRTAKLGPLWIRTIHGEPYYVQGRKLTPIARIVSLGKAKATIGTKRISAYGGGFAWIKPLAVLEETPEGEHRIAITDGSAVAARSLLGVALGLALFFAAIRWLARQSF
jgi:hypothetical protein